MPRTLFLHERKKKYFFFSWPFLMFWIGYLILHPLGHGDNPGLNADPQQRPKSWPADRWMPGVSPDPSVHCTRISSRDRGVYPGLREPGSRQLEIYCSIVFHLHWSIKMIKNFKPAATKQQTPSIGPSSVTLVSCHEAGWDGDIY